jgi:protein-tyrosine phosphatase
VFCAVHLRAPAGQRGGWLSAEKRRRQRANDPTMTLDASNIARRLWVGGKPPLDRALPDFDVLVLCAQEIQPELVSFQGTVIRCPLPDAALTPAELARAVTASRTVAERLVAQDRVLVTCAMGINRSALVTSLALGLCTRMSATTIISLIRARRHPECLSNQHFCEVLHRFIGKGRSPR